MVCRLRLSHRLGQDAADAARDVAVGDGLYSSTEMVARVRRFRRTMLIRRLWVVFTPSAVNSTGVLLRSSSLALSSFRISLTYWGGRQPLSSSWTVSGSSMGCWQQAAVIVEQDHGVVHDAGGLGHDVVQVGAGENAAQGAHQAGDCTTAPSAARTGPAYWRPGTGGRSPAGGTGRPRRRTEKVPQNFGHTIDLWADSV